MTRKRERETEDKSATGIPSTTGMKEKVSSTDTTFFSSLTREELTEQQTSFRFSCKQEKREDPEGVFPALLTKREDLFS